MLDDGPHLSPWDVLCLRTFCAMGRFVSGPFCPLGRFVRREVLSLGTFCPQGRFVFGTFCLGTICLGTFCMCIIIQYEPIFFKLKIKKLRSQFLLDILKHYFSILLFTDVLIDFLLWSKNGYLIITGFNLLFAYLI